MAKTNGLLLFTVIANGHEYRIYTNGKVEGFGTDVKVINNFPRLHFGRPQEEPVQKFREEDIPHLRSA